MRKPAHPYVEDFRDTPYGRQLHEGFRLLRFRAPLEGIFVAIWTAMRGSRSSWRRCC